MNIQDLFEECAEYRRQLFSDGIDGIQADADERVITLDGWYHIYATQCKTKTALLSWVAQIAAKKWVTRKQIYWFIRIMSAWNGINPYDGI